MFFWIALFVWSLALQYVSAIAPADVTAASGLKAGTVAGFEIDGNLKCQDAAGNPGAIPDGTPPPNLIDGTLTNGDDWTDNTGCGGKVDPASPPTSTIVADPINDTGDDVFGGGAKEDDTQTWSYTTQKPTPKDDVHHAMAYAKFVGTSAFFFAGATRIVNNGDTHIDFELNRLPFKTWADGISKPNRSVGDVLISLEFSNGGSDPEVTVYKVTAVVNHPNGQTTTFGADVATAAAVHSATNFVDLPDQGLGYAIPTFEFAETSIDLGALGINTSCPGLSNGHIRTRSGGDIDSSQLKDNIQPFPIDLNNCGKVTIIKDAVPNSAQDFAFTTTGGAPLADFSLDDDGDGTLSDTKTFNSVPPGTYTVTEGAVAMWELTDLDCVNNGSGGSVSIAQRKATIDVDPNEHVTCTFENTKLKNSPTIATAANQTGVVVGETISDSATLAGATASAGGTITFRAYGPNDPNCDKTPAFTSSPVAVNGNGTYGPVSFAAQNVGTYLWIASYSGDADNNPVAGACGDPGETDTTIKDSPTISTVASAPITIGGSVSDTATLAGGFNPTGTITFKLYGPNDATCANPAVFTTTKAVSGNGSYTSATFTPLLVGTYRWIASYGGDANNNSVSGNCNDANESVVVSPATPGIATSAAESVVIGNAIHDTAVLSGAVGPTGTITFNLYATADCSGAPLYTTTVDVTGNGSYGPVSFTPAAVGTYHWIASYSGDGNNSPIAGACGDAGENDTVIKASPAIATSANESVVVGNAIHDTAALSGGVTPTGTITFNLYATADCSGAPLYTTSLPVAGNGSYGPVQFTPATVGVYHWIASYGGDAKNNPIAGVCGDAGENDTVTPAAPGIATSANESVVIGNDVHDTAALSGGVSPTGTITFTAYSDAQCQTSVFTTSLPVTGNGSYGPVSFTPAAVGTYHWIASYSGDGNNSPIAGACGDAGENDTVIKASPAIATSANESVVIGNAIHDTAALSGGVSPTGTITFNAYSTADCSGAAAFTTTLPVAGNGSYGPVQFTPTAVGVYHWIASYGGDAKNNSIAGACGDAGENDTVIKASPEIATLATDGGVAGDQISDTASLSGAYLPTSGTITFNLYSATDPGCEDDPIFTSTVAISAAGTATSASFTVTLAGTYHWIASYSGDAHNNAVAGACGDEGETTVINKFNPEITTSLSSGDLSGPKITVLFGASVTDQATLTGASATAGGSVTYTVYTDNECTNEYKDAGTKTVVNGVVGESDAVTFPTAGTYYWQAAYSGDLNNAPATSDCTDEVLTVTTPDLHTVKLVKTNDGSFGPTSTANPGDTLTFQITITNSGDADATNVPVSDDINDVLAHATYNDDCSNSCDFAGGVLTWTIPTIAKNGGSVVLTFSVDLDDTFPAGTTHLPNVVVVTGPGSNCPDESQDPDCDTDTTVEAAPDLDVEKLVKTNDGDFAPTSTAEPGDILTFQITVKNTGDADATDVPVTDDINAVLEHAIYNDDCSNACSVTNGVLNWTIDVPAGGQVILTYSVTLADTFPAGTTHLPNIVVVTGPGSNCPDESQDPDCDTDTTVEAAPDLNVLKEVATNEGEFGPTSAAQPGDTLNYRITITNTGDADATAIPVTDDINDILAHATYNDDCSNSCGFAAGVLSWTVDVPANGGSVVLTFSVDLAAEFPDGTTTLPNVVVVEGPGSNCPEGEGDEDCDTTTTVDEFLLVIDKTNDAPLEELVLPDGSTAMLPTADEGDTVTYTLSYTVGDLDVTSAVITDVVPEGLQYKDGTATGNAEFTFNGYDSVTRTLSWTAATVTENGSVTYQVLVLTGASKLAQPLTNVAAIDSAETEPDEASSDVFVPVIPLEETAPPTDVSPSPEGTSTPGFSLMLILAVLGGLVLTIGFVTPVPAAVRRRNRR